VNDLKLPPDLVTFLGDGKQLAYDRAACVCGRVELYALDALKPETIWVQPAYTEADPHEDDQGLYRVEAVDLTKQAEHFPPEFILLWLPGMECFGTWDCAHYRLIVFPNATWAEIAGNPLPYLNAQWDPKMCGVGVTAPVWTTYPFIPGHPDQKEAADRSD
jgi:hypothetical protein